MANDSPDTHASSDRDEMSTADPDGATAANTANTSIPRKTPPQQVPSTTTSTTTSATTSPLKTQSSSNLVPPTSSSPSAGTSPQTSRNTSPIRKEVRPALTTAPATQPSAAAIQRALSAANVPQMAAGPLADGVSRLPRAPKSVGSGSGETTPQWPLSPRKSPPTSATASRRGSTKALKLADQGKAPAITVEPSSLPSPTTPISKANAEESRKTDPSLQPPPPKPVSRGPSGKSTLETVQENSSDSVDPSPAAFLASAELKPSPRAADDDKSKREPSADSSDKDKDKANQQPIESGSESAGNKSDQARSRRESAANGTVKSAKSGAKEGYGTLSSAKSRQAEGKQGMTVETETVPSIPQSALNPGDRAAPGRNDNSGSVKAKPSTETIRPKKERKKPSQKSRNITQGTSSSKADIFEARVANAVEANSSDSDETFVYESNPPETRPRRHHSRTPSVTSAHSTADQRGIRPFGEMDERRVAGKRSMKFSSNQNDFDSPDSRSGTVRSSYRTQRRGPRYDRDGNTVSSNMDESPFTQASKIRNQQLGSRFSRPGSPRSPTSLQQQRASGPPNFFTRKNEQSFDFDGEGADDERTPLVGTVRTNRGSRGARRMHSSHAHSLGNFDDYDDFYVNRDRSSWSGLVRGCLLGVSVLIGVIICAILLLVVWNRPLYDVQVKKIQNVLATEQELILDVLVGAVNPNALSVQISEMDINVFAKSKHVGKDHTEDPLTISASLPLTERQRRPTNKELAEIDCDDDSCDLSAHWHAPWTRDGHDHGTDPDPDEGVDAQTMLLGRVFHFDQPLTFENSLWSRHYTYSLGELTLHKPGNKTEEGGSERWENVLQHPFELIVRGVLKYTLPISTKIQKVAVEASVLVHPEDGVDSFGRMRVEEVDNSDHWQWIDWEDFKPDEAPS